MSFFFYYKSKLIFLGFLPQTAVLQDMTPNAGFWIDFELGGFHFFALGPIAYGTLLILYSVIFEGFIALLLEIRFFGDVTLRRVCSSRILPNVGNYTLDDNGSYPIRSDFSFSYKFAKFWKTRNSTPAAWSSGLNRHIRVNQYVPSLSLFYPHMAVTAQHLPIQLYESWPELFAFQCICVTVRQLPDSVGP